MTEERQDDKGSRSAKFTLLLFIPILATGGTALVSYFRFFSIEEVILNVIISAALCIVAEIPLRRLCIDKHGAVYFVYTYLAGLLMAVLSGFSFEFILPIAGPAVLIGILGDPATGLSALMLFTGISNLVLHESGLYFFFVYFTGFILMMFFALDRKLSMMSAAFVTYSVGAVTFYSCALLSHMKITPEMVVFPIIGISLDFLLILIMRPKIYENVLDRREIFINKILDPEYDYLKKLKAENRREYDKMVHSVHLANILMERMGLDRLKLLGAGYYSRIGVLRGERDNIDAKSLSMIHERNFPHEIRISIQEYYGLKELRLSRESGTVYITNTLIDRIYSEKDSKPGQKIDYGTLVAGVMKEIAMNKRILQSDLSLNDLNIISETLKKQVFYYDVIL